MIRWEQSGRNRKQTFRIQESSSPFEAKSSTKSNPDPWPLQTSTIRYQVIYIPYHDHIADSKTLHITYQVIHIYPISWPHITYQVIYISHIMTTYLISAVIPYATYTDWTSPGRWSADGSCNRRQRCDTRPPSPNAPANTVRIQWDHNSPQERLAYLTFFSRTMCLFSNTLMAYNWPFRRCLARNTWNMSRKSVHDIRYTRYHT
jgi:hypothetical protein